MSDKTTKDINLHLFIFFLLLLNLIPKDKSTSPTTHGLNQW